MKVFSVLIEAKCEVVVFADSEEQALDIAARSINYGDLELLSGGPAEEVVDDPEDPGERDSYVRHADVLFDEHGRSIRTNQALSLLAELAKGGEK